MNNEDDFKRFCKQEECQKNDTLQGLSMTNRSGFSSKMRYSKYLKTNAKDKTKWNTNIVLWKYGCIWLDVDWTFSLVFYI